MTPVAASLPLPPPAAIDRAAAPAFNPSDLDRLRELIQATASQTANPAGVTQQVPGAAPVAGSRSLGDSILDGVFSFSRNYQHSMHAIESRLQDVVNTESAGLSNLSDIVALQIDVSKWSMSVMGVDNASKAGSNTIKELSRGG